MLINKYKKAVINIRLILLVQLRNFQMTEIAPNIFNCATKHIFLFFFPPIYLHSKHSAA